MSKTSIRVTGGADPDRTRARCDQITPQGTQDNLSKDISSVQKALTKIKGAWLPFLGGLGRRLDYIIGIQFRGATFTAWFFWGNCFHRKGFTPWLELVPSTRQLHSPIRFESAAFWRANPCAEPGG
jgi:hypothetical protein